MNKLLLGIFLVATSAFAGNANTTGVLSSSGSGWVSLVPPTSCKEGWIKITVPSSTGVKEKCVAAGDLEDPIVGSAASMPSGTSGSIYLSPENCDDHGCLAPNRLK